MGTLSTLPFDEQCALIEATLASGDDPRPLLREAASLPDAEPLACLLDGLAEQGRLDSDLERELASLTMGLEDAALQHLFTRGSSSHLDEVLGRVAEHALGTWPIERISALAFLARWLRRRAPEAHARAVARAEAELAGGARDGRALVLASGARLAALARDPDAAPWVRQATSRAIEALARAPKSISQAHAERLLAQRVYADPGHFFFELLQNAADAGATRWSVAIERDRVIARHDGAPFSLLDLVGVLSIGQTTKREGQIGFFGVGFKSVYEICERPRVHSGALDVEIAHVSIPRALGAPTLALEPGETCLVLPYARPTDAEALHRRALAIPPEALLWLGSVRAIEVRGPSGELEAWREEREGSVRVLRRGDEARRYRVGSCEVRYAGAREPGRARASTVAVALAIDASGAPRPVDGPTLYAFLPTAERTGLRALVHARFDVTLDRERLVLDSRWNEALLEAAGRTMAELVAELAGEGAAVLSALPSGDAELAPGIAPLARALREGLREVPCLPAAVPGGVGPDGAASDDAARETIAPVRARLLEPALARALAGLDLGGGRAVALLPDRERAVAAWLGARPFEPDDLAAWLAETCAPGEAPPGWLGDAVLEALSRASSRDERLRELAILVDAGGRLVRARDARVVPPRWARLYAGERAVISTDALAALPDALVARLAIPRLEVGALLDDLHDASRRARLVARGDALFEVLAELDDAALSALDDVPLLPRAGGGAPVARGAGLVRLDRVLASLAEVLAPRMPLLDPAFEARHPVLARRWVPCFDLEALVAALEAGASTGASRPATVERSVPAASISEAATSERALAASAGSTALALGALGDEARDALAAILDREAPRLPRALARRFAALPLFRDCHGARRPLLGPGRALRPARARDELRAALPRWPWLEAPERPFVDVVEPPSVDARAVAIVLAGGGASELPMPSPDELPAVAGALAARASELPAAAVDALAAAPIWLDREGVPRPLAELRRGTPSAALDALYEAIGGRSVASPSALSLARALGLDARLPASDHAALVADLVRDGAPASAPRDVLAAALVEACATLPASALAPLAEVAMWQDEAGALRPLGTWSSPQERACHRAGPHRDVLRAGPFPLLAAEDEARFAPLLDRLEWPVATAADVVRNAERLTRDVARLVEFLDAHGDALDEPSRALLSALPIFASRAGERRSARDLVLRAPLERALGTACLDALALDDVLFRSEDEARALRWQLPTRPVGELLEARVLPGLVASAPLSSQPAPWDRRDALSSLAKLVAASGLDPLGAPLAVDAREHVVRGPLFLASDAARRTVAALDLAARLADPEWAAMLELGSPLVAPLPVRRVAEALRAACPEEAPRAEHPIVRDVPALLAWLRESAAELAADGPSRDALGAASVLPSQRGTLRAPRDLVLDPSLPDLGLGWGLAPDVPDDVARWLRATFELDRRARRSLVAHVLDGLDAARADDDRERAGRLVGFLARALGAGEVTAAELEERARRLDVRARLRVPLAGGGWDKPRFAWAPSDDVAARADAFASELPPRIQLPEPDGPSALLLAACGAKDDLDDAAIVACLEGRGLREGPGARRALARYVVLRALEMPARIERWGLATRTWLPAADGVLRRPRELVWPDALARELLEASDPLLPDPEVVFDLDESAAARLGLRRAHELSLAEIASRAVGRQAHPSLLDWLERGLREGRLSPADVRAALAPEDGETILLRDDEGTLRSPRALAVSGARQLFGSRRGDLGAGGAHPRLAHALGIPKAPDFAMIRAFLVEVGAAIEALSEHERAALARRLPECVARAAELARPHDRLPEGAALAALRRGRVELVRCGDPELRLRAPDALAQALAHDAALADPLPVAREERLEAFLLASGVPDLWSALRVHEVLPGPRRAALDARAEALRAGLAVTLGEAAFARAEVHDAVVIRGEIALPERAEPIEARVDAWIDGRVLRLVPEVLDDPARLAPILAPAPERRAEVAAWLEEGRAAGRWARVELAPASMRSPRPARRDDGLFARIRRWLGGDSSTSRPEPRGSEPRAPEPRASEPRASEPRPPVPRASSASRRRDAPSAREEAFFRPDVEIRSQLEQEGDWLEERREAPRLGFAFSPPRLEAPWLYAPKLIASRFDRAGQRWSAAHLARPVPRGDAGLVVMRGRLPAGESVLPVPLYGRVVELRAIDADARPITGASGATALRLDAPAEVRLRVSLGRVPSLDEARPMRGARDELSSFVPDDELPDETRAAVEDLDPAAPALSRALALRDFVRERYRYDPSYLEDPSVARFLARVGRGRAHAHVAALHAGRDATHLGAGVCFELNALTCELLRRAGIPAVLATGWVLDGGALSEPDHLWVIALLEDAAGAPVWAPIDASATRDGRPLRVPRRPPIELRAPRDPEARAPVAPHWALGGGERGSRGSDAEREPRRRKRASPPTAELRRVLHHLARLTGRSLDEAERAALERALSDPGEAASLLERLRRP